MRECTFMRKLAIPLDEPGADILLSAWFDGTVRKWAGSSGGARADLEELARDVGEILCFARRGRFRFPAFGISMPASFGVRIVIVRRTVFVVGGHDGQG